MATIQTTNPNRRLGRGPEFLHFLPHQHPGSQRTSRPPLLVILSFLRPPSIHLFLALLAIPPLLDFLALPPIIVFHHLNESSTDLPSSIVSHHLLSSVSAPKGNARPAKDNVIPAKVASLKFPNPNESHHPLLFVVLHSNLTDSRTTTEISDILAFRNRHIRESKVDICPLQAELTLHPAET